MIAERDRRKKAELAEHATAAISLHSDKDDLLAAARSLRLRADAIERSFGGAPGRTASKSSAAC